MIATSASWSDVQQSYDSHAERNGDDMRATEMATGMTGYSDIEWRVSVPRRGEDDDPPIKKIHRDGAAGDVRR